MQSTEDSPQLRQWWRRFNRAQTLIHSRGSGRSLQTLGVRILSLVVMAGVDLIHEKH